jgi:hypothetical protein
MGQIVNFVLINLHIPFFCLTFAKDLAVVVESVDTKDLKSFGQ